MAEAKLRLTKLAPERGTRWSAFFIAIGMVLAAAAVIAALIGAQKSPHIPPGGMANVPSSTRPNAKAVANYTVAPDLPKYISIPAIGVSKARVIQLGLLKSGAIATPDNIYDTGWYDGSTKPGQPGAMFIYGHVSSWTADGVFLNLKKLRAGDIIAITRGDNKTFTYHVASTKIYPYNNINMRQVLSPANANKPGLNLMTCTGKVIKGTSEFNERLVVFSDQISG